MLAWGRGEFLLVLLEGKVTCLIQVRQAFTFMWEESFGHGMGS